MGTKERILQASLMLFNDLGERNVTTNHIATHLNISPGNLYYHFRNKQAIIFALFESYQQDVLRILQVPQGRPLAPQDKLDYLKAIFKGLWDYRFLHRDMEHLLHADPKLHAEYQQFFRICLAGIKMILQGLRGAGIIAINDVDIDSLALNTWIIVTSWFSFLRSNLLPSEQDGISQELLDSGIYQIFALERPYLTEPYREAMWQIQQRYASK